MADNPLSAELDAIRNRAALSYASPARMAESAADVPRLLAALNEVLKDHKPSRIVVFGALCRVHENHRHFLITQREADEVAACESCSATVYASCDGCGGSTPFTSCRVRQVIACALTGDEAGDGTV